MQSIFRDAVRTAEHICGMHISLCAHWLQLHFLPIGQQARMDGPLLCDAPVLRPEAEIIRGAVSAPAKHLGQRHIGPTAKLRLPSGDSCATTSRSYGKYPDASAVGCQNAQASRAIPKT